MTGGVSFDILPCWMDNHLKKFEYSLQVKYKGQVTTTMENVKLVSDLLLKIYNFLRAWTV